MKKIPAAGDAVKVRLTEKHELGGDVEHAAKFLRAHSDGEWCDVELEKEHAGGVKRLSVPLSQIVAAIFLLFLLAAPAHAQFIGYVSPQTFTQQVFAGQTTAAITPIPPPTPLGCTPTNGNPCGVRNLGQTFHFFTYVASAASCVVDFAIQGSYDGTHFFNISADASANNVLIGSGNSSGGLSANGWYPIIAVNLINISNCAGGVSGFYSGTSSAISSTFGIFQQSTGVRQSVLQNTNLNAGLTITTLATPANSTGARLFLTCTVTCGAGTDQFNVLDSPSPPQAQRTIATFTAANSTALQVFVIPAVTGPYIQITFPAGNFTSTNATAYIEFDTPGTPAATANAYKEINSNASTQVRTGIGFLENIVVNNAGSAWTMQVFDNSACSGTAIAGATAFTIPAAGSNLRYDVNFNTGLCILTAGTTPGSVTVSFR